MGWLKPKFTPTLGSPYQSSTDDHNSNTEIIRGKDSHKSSAQHLERIDSHAEISTGNTTTTTTDEESLVFPFQPTYVKDIDLPFIPSTVVLRAQKSFNRVWIVVDNIVFDCTNFLHEHPGGNMVVESFAGQDCSWQFWRFHNPVHMRESGLRLRIGRTVGVENRFKERPRFVGLRGLDGWG